MMFRASILAVLLAVPLAAKAQPPAEIRVIERSMGKAIAAAEPSAAYIAVARKSGTAWRELIASDHVPEYSGGGIVVDHRLVLTCYHVVKEANTIAVRLPPLKPGEASRIAEATVYAADSRSDLAILKLADPRIETPALPLGEGEQLTRGRFVLAISNPQTEGFRDGGGTASLGIVSALRQRLPGSPREEERGKSLYQYGHLIQTDARMPSLGSGAGLVDLDGKLVGLTTSIAGLTGPGVGSYAIPIDGGIRRVIETLKKGEEVEYGFLGVQTDAGPFRRGSSNGVILQGITGNSPAAKAGLRTGDRVVSFNGQPITTYDDMFLHIGLGLAGRESVIQIQRGDGKPMNVPVTLAKYFLNDQGVATNRPPAIHGLRVDFASVIAMNSRREDNAIPDGVVVREAIAHSPAYGKLAEFHDIIREVNGVATHTPAEFYREAEKAVKAQQPVRLTVFPDRTVTLP